VYGEQMMSQSEVFGAITGS